jgi:hypothetical protein
MTQLPLPISPTPAELGIRRCTRCGRHYRTHGFDAVPEYTLDRLWRWGGKVGKGVCKECKEGR